MNSGKGHKKDGFAASRARITRRAFLEKAASGGTLLMAATVMPYSSIASPEKDYSRLVDFMKLPEKKEPLLVFDDFEKTNEEECRKTSMDYLDAHPELIRDIKEDLGGGEVKWRIDDFKHRFLFVPERRPEYEALFQDYCHDAIEYMLDKTGFHNPYRKIETLLHDKPEIPKRAVTVFLVHNLAREFVGTYSFFNHKRKTSVVLKGKIFTGIVGSYTTRLRLRARGHFGFVNDTYTIWQNSARNPYTVLTVPVEETLHIVLREHTHREIKQDIQLNGAKSAVEVKKIVKDWLAAEEAVVGGIVHAVLPDFVKKHANNVPDSLIAADKDAKCERERYCDLEQGIEIIEKIGYKEAINMYTNDARKFKKLLIPSSLI